MLVKGMSRLNWMSQSEQHILHTWCLAGCCVHYGRGSNSGSWWCPSKKWNGRNWTSHLSNIPGASLNVGVRSGRGSNSGSWWCQSWEWSGWIDWVTWATYLVPHWMLLFVLAGEATLEADELSESELSESVWATYLVLHCVLVSFWGRRSLHQWMVCPPRDC